MSGRFRCAVVLNTNCTRSVSTMGWVHRVHMVHTWGGASEKFYSPSIFLVISTAILLRMPKACDKVGLLPTRVRFTTEKAKA